MVPEIDFEHLTSIPLFLAIAIAVVPASLIGSLHCVGMCGPLIVASTQNRWEIISYQIGRGFSYIALGAMTGAFSRSLIYFLNRPLLRWSALVLSSLFILSLGISLIRQKTPHLPFPKFLLKWVAKFQAQHFRSLDPGAFRSAVVGSLSALLPCGWLHVFLLLALASHSAATGSVIMALFWLGTVPALSLAPLISNHLGRWIGQFVSVKRASQVAGFAVISIGLGAIVLKAAPLFRTGSSTYGKASISTDATSCHSTETPIKDDHGGK